MRSGCPRPRPEKRLSPPRQAAAQVLRDVGTRVQSCAGRPGPCVAAAGRRLSRVQRPPVRRRLAGPCPQVDRRGAPGPGGWPGAEFNDADPTPADREHDGLRCASSLVRDMAGGPPGRRRRGCQPWWRARRGPAVVLGTLAVSARVVRRRVSDVRAVQRGQVDLSGCPGAARSWESTGPAGGSCSVLPVRQWDVRRFAAGSRWCARRPDQPGGGARILPPVVAGPAAAPGVCRRAGQRPFDHHLPGGGPAGVEVRSGVCLSVCRVLGGATSRIRRRVGRRSVRRVESAHAAIVGPAIRGVPGSAVRRVVSLGCPLLVIVWSRRSGHGRWWAQGRGPHDRRSCVHRGKWVPGVTPRRRRALCPGHRMAG